MVVTFVLTTAIECHPDAREVPTTEVLPEFKTSIHNAPPETKRILSRYDADGYEPVPDPVVPLMPHRKSPECDPVE